MGAHACIRSKSQMKGVELCMGTKKLHKTQNENSDVSMNKQSSETHPIALTN